MSLPTIKRFLSLDNVDSDPADVSAANPTKWPTASDVADYAYKSLSTIWVLSGIPTSGELGSTIRYKKGETANNAKQELVLLHLPEDSWVFDEGMKSSNPGALDYTMEILYKLPQGVEDYDRLLNTSLRVRYLLDASWRRKRGAKPLHISVNPKIDKSVDGGLICFWQGYCFPPNGSEFVEKWRVHQEIIVPS